MCFEPKINPFLHSISVKVHNIYQIPSLKSSPAFLNKNPFLKIWMNFFAKSWHRQCQGDKNVPIKFEIWINESFQKKYSYAFQISTTVCHTYISNKNLQYASKILHDERKVWPLMTPTHWPRLLSYFLNDQGACTNHMDKRGGMGVAQMTTTLNNSYLVKVSTQGGGGVKIAQNSVHVVCTCPLNQSNVKV